MLNLVAALQGGIAGWGFVDYIIFIIIVAACLGIMFIVLRVFGIAIPGWLIQIVWICVAAFVAIVAIRFVLSL